MAAEEQVVVDGRRARRERSRAAVIDAVFALVQDGKVPPDVEQVAERAGVSVSSIFRTFDGLDDMRSQALEQFDSRYAHLLHIEVDAGGTLTSRIDRLVRTRVRLYDEAGPLLTLARQRALEYERMADAVGRSRALFAAQVRTVLAPERRTLSPTQAADLVAAVDAATSPEAYAVLGAAHARTSRQIVRTWTRAVGAIVREWTEEGPT